MGTGIAMDNPITFCYTLDAHSIDIAFGSGSSGTDIVLNALANGVTADFYKGCILTWNGVSKTVTAYNAGTKHATINSAFATNPTSSNTYRMQMQKQFDALLVVGHNDADDVNYFPEDEAIRLLNGNYYSPRPRAFNRQITVNLGIITLQIDRVFLHSFHFYRYYCSLIYDLEEVEIIPPKKLANELQDGVESMKSYSFTFLERVARTTQPSSWT